MIRLSTLFQCPILVGALLLATPQLGAGDLPKGEVLMDRFVQATGGKEAYAKIKSRILKVNMIYKGKKGKLIIYQKAPNLMYQEINMPGLAPIRVGYNGKVAWEINPLINAVVHRGAEEDKLKRIAALDREFNWRKYFKSAKTAGEEAVNGKSTYKVELTSTAGAAQFRYFDKKSGLMLKKVDKIKTDMKELEFITDILNYKKSNGILIDSHARSVLAGQKTELKLESVQYNADIPDSRFDLPAVVKKLLKDS